METTDEHLIIEACQQSRLEDFALLYDKYHVPIYRYVYYRTFDKETAEDLTSQTFLKALERIRTFDPQRGNFGAWLYRIARNAVIDHVRAKRPVERMDEDWDRASGENVAGDVATRMEFRRIREALDGLDPLKRDIVLLRLWDNLSYKEIAAIVGKTEGNCKVIFSRTVEGLRSRFGPQALLALLLLLSSLHP
ncbi:MAG: sigma-70 family RNA polymerase sigma factor [Candidatus Peribacteraceae bacterium]|nr:sigma-70 family RNA polymerase sigma factor [Candidatus Peribacteraceae bacterium]